jgi:Ice-binding-like
MTQLKATMMKSNLSQAKTACLAILLGTACSSSGGATSSDDGGTTDSGSAVGQGNSSGGMSAMDAARPADAEGTPGDETLTDRGSAAESGITPDSGSVASTPAVNLGTAGNYAILAKSGISTVPTSAITGSLGVSPAAASYITGFSLIADSTNAFSTSPQVTGHVFASDYAQPTPSNLTTAIGDMQLAFTDAAGRAPGVTELGAGNIGGMTLSPGVYKWGTGLLIPTNVTLSGGAADVWIFQIAQSLTMSAAAKIVLTGGAAAKNVFWQVAGLADLGTTAHLEGVVLSQTSIALRTGASVLGRLFAQTAVTIDGSSIVAPGP